MLAELCDERLMKEVCNIFGIVEYSICGLGNLLLVSRLSRVDSLEYAPEIGSITLACGCDEEGVLGEPHRRRKSGSAI